MSRRALESPVLAVHTAWAAAMAALLAAASPVRAEIVFVHYPPGTGAPPPTLGAYEMTTFPLDPRPLYEDVLALPSPLGGEILFSIPMSHRRIGSGWTLVGHGYQGDVYYTKGEHEVTLTMPVETSAFYFYPSANYHATVVATAQDGTSSGEFYIYFGIPAPYFGFYGTQGQRIESITVEAVEGGDFALGDFGVARYDCDGPPEPAQGVQASDGGYADRVVVSWDADVCAEEYRVYRHTDDEPDDAVPVSDWLSGQLSFEDTTAELGVVYWYWLQARNAEGESEFSEADAGFAWPVALRVGTGASAADGPWPSGVGVPCPGE